MLKYKPYFVLTSKVELSIRQKQLEDTQAEEERVLLRQKSKRRKRDILLIGKKRTENAMKRAQILESKSRDNIKIKIQ